MGFRGVLCVFTYANACLSNLTEMLVCLYQSASYHILGGHALNACLQLDNQIIMVKIHN